VTRSRKTAADVEERDADVYAAYVSDLRRELLEPPEFVLCDRPLQPRGRVIRGGLADWWECVETVFPPDGGHGGDPGELRPRG
jgi:hypothetical protein